MPKISRKSTTRGSTGPCGAGRLTALSTRYFPARCISFARTGGWISPSFTAKKGGDNLGYSGHKHLKGDKAVAFCDTPLQHHLAIHCRCGCSRPQIPLMAITNAANGFDQKVLVSWYICLSDSFEMCCILTTYTSRMSFIFANVNFLIFNYVSV